MVDVLHLVDDPALGGVNRVLANQLPQLQGEFIHERRMVRTVRNLPPFEPAKVVCVHFTVSWAKLPYLIALRRQCPGKLVLVEHSYTGAYEEHCVPDKKRFRSMLRLAYGLFDQVVAVSYGQAAWLRSADLVPFDRLTTIRQCVDLTAFLDVPLPPVRSGPLRLGSYGRLVTQKGYDILIEAMRLVDPDSAELHLAGHGPDAELLLAQASRLPHVFIETAFVNPVHFLAKVDAIILPSRWEAYGVVAVESRAAGRPILVSDVDGLSEQTREGAGLCMDASSPRAIAAAIKCLVRGDFPLLVSRARRSVNGHFEHFIQEWRNLTADLLQSQHVGEPEIQFSLSVTEELARLAG